MATTRCNMQTQAEVDIIVEGMGMAAIREMVDTRTIIIVEIGEEEEATLVGAGVTAETSSNHHPSLSRAVKVVSL